MQHKFLEELEEIAGETLDLRYGAMDPTLNRNKKNRTIDGKRERRCYDCQISKPIDEFYYLKSRRNYHGACKPCVNKNPKSKHT